MQTAIQARLVQRLEKFDQELDSAIYLLDELSKYNTVGNEDSKSIIDTYGTKLLAMRQNLKHFLLSNSVQSQG